MSTTLNRRALVAGAAAALPAIAGLSTAAAAAPAPDPIFAAIEAHRAAWTHLQDNPSANKVDLLPEDDAECDRRCDAVQDAAGALADTHPTTITGVIALLRYVAGPESADPAFDFVDEDDGETKPWSFFIHHNLADALEMMTPAA
jgi:hypothetical protein